MPRQVYRASCKNNHTLLPQNLKCTCVVFPKISLFSRCLNSLGLQGDEETTWFYFFSLYKYVIYLFSQQFVYMEVIWDKGGVIFIDPINVLFVQALLEYERHKSQSGELELAVAALPEPSNVENDVISYTSYILLFEFH